MELGRIVNMISALAKEATENELFHMLTACSSILHERKDEEQRQKNELERERQRNAIRMAVAAPSSTATYAAYGSFLPPTRKGTWDLELMDSIKLRHHDLEMEWIQTAMDYTFVDNNKIAAIKFFRLKMNLGLKEAKDIVDSMCSMYQDHMVRQNKAI